MQSNYFRKSKCGKCDKSISKIQAQITCWLCESLFHAKCQGLTKTDTLRLINIKCYKFWCCNTCTSEILPLENLNNFEQIRTRKRIDNSSQLLETNILKKCHTCNKIMGKIFKKCDLCDNLSHVRCNRGNMGCLKCLNDIYPGFHLPTVGELNINYKHDINSLHFNPYSQHAHMNSIGNAEMIDSINEQIAWQSVSSNLNNCKFENLSEIKTSRPGELKIMSLNVRSLKKAFPRLKDMEHTHLSKFDILCFNETSCRTSELPFGVQEIILDGFHEPIIQEPARASGLGGGLAIYVSKKLCIDSTKISICENLSSSENFEHGEHLYIEIDMGSKTKNIIIGNLYRSPSGRLIDFQEKHKDNLEKLEKHKDKIIIILGDSNIDLLKFETFEPAHTYLNVYTEHNFAPLISRPTRITSNTATLIDHIFSNSCHKVTRSGVIMLDISDHLATYATVLLNESHCATLIDDEPDDYTPACAFDRENFTRFHLCLKSQDWVTVTSVISADQKFSEFVNIYNTHYNKAFENKNDGKNINSQRKRRKNSKPWMQDWLAGACERKNKAYYNYIRHPNEANKIKYKKLKIFVEKHVRKAKNEYYTSYFKKYSHDSRKQWSMINKILNRKRKSKNTVNKLLVNGEILNDTSDIAEAFNEYFVNVAQNLKNCDGPRDVYSTLNTSNRSRISIELDPCSAIEIKEIINSFKNKSTADTSMQALKHVSSEIIPILVHTINASLTQGIFPSDLKCAKVIPLYKGGSKVDISNYRPISLLPIFSKIYERIMHTRIYNFLNSKNDIYSGQYGFRKGHSCEHAIISAQNTILHALDKKQIAILLLIDFSKAFDMVDHTILLDKLNHYGIRNNALQWMRSYLDNRVQYTCNGKHKSSTQVVKYGVPQGSILGPLLFIIYVNDIPEISNIAKFVMYADDANIIISGSNMNEIQSKIEQLSNRLQNWVKQNGLKMNLKKTKYMIFANKNVKFGSVDVFLDGTKIERVIHERFLGVILDDKLNWAIHRKALASKISRNAGILYRLRGTVPQNVMLTLYYSFIQSHLSYCSLLWGIGSNSSIKSIFASQKKAVRALEQNFINYSYNKETGKIPGHTKPSFTKYNLLTVQNIILQHVLTFMQKIYNESAPYQTRSYFIVVDRAKIARARKSRCVTNFFEIPKTRIKLFDKTIFIQGPRMYNIICTNFNKSKLISKNDLPLHRQFTTPFKNTCKKYILELQSSGDGSAKSSSEWSIGNFPLFNHQIQV